MVTYSGILEIKMLAKDIKVPKITEMGNVALTRGQLNKDTPAGHKKCYVCGAAKHKSLFSNNASRVDGLQTYCKDCGKVNQSKWYYKRAHGITLEERDAILNKQDNRCAICNNETQFKLKAGKGSNIGIEAVIDHCHSSLKIRGVLCGSCNTGLGAFRDNVDSLFNAIEYLQNSVEN